MADEKKANNGGPAFPGQQGHTPAGTWNQTYEPGMSVREYASIASMQGLLANSDLSAYMRTAGIKAEQLKEALTKSAVGFADALIAELSK